MLSEADVLLAELIELFENTVPQQVEIITPNEEIAEMLCTRYNNARKYVMRMRGETPSPREAGFERVEEVDPDDYEPDDQYPSKDT